MPASQSGRGARALGSGPAIAWQALTVVALLLAARPACAMANTANFHIAAQPLPMALKDFATQSHMEILYRYDEIAGITCNAVAGRLDTHAALGELLRNTGLEAVYNSGKAATIRPVRVHADGSAPSSNTRKSEGKSSTSGALHLSQAAPVGPASPAPAAPSQGQTGVANQQDPALEEVVVTGSRIAHNSVFDIPNPVTQVSATDLKLTGQVNVEQALAQNPQFVGSTNGGSQSNVVPGGEANVDLRGLQPWRTLVLVNGRRYTVDTTQGTNLTTDINTIPQALIERVDVVTGGSSAVYGSDAIAGVVNFIMKQNFQGVEFDGHTNFDEITKTPTYSFDITAGSNFDDNRGNLAVSIDYMDRGAVARDQVGYARPALSDGCVTPGSWSDSGPGTPVAGNPSGAKCLAAGGVPGLIAGGSSDIPNGRFAPLSSSLLPGGSNAALNAAYAAAGLGGMGSFGWTFDNAGTTPRPAENPQDLYDLSLVNYLQVPQKRWMINSFGHFDFAPKVEGYTEFHFSDNQVTALLAPSNSDGTFLFNINNPYLSAPMQAVLGQLAATQTTSICSSLDSAICTTPGGNLVAISAGRRFVETGDRVDVEDREAWRFVGGVRGDLGNLTAHYFTDVSYDAYFMDTQTNDTDHQTGAISKSRLQESLLSVGGAAPLCDIFGATINAACAKEIGIQSTNLTTTQMRGGAASLNGTVADLWAGPMQFALGTEHRYYFTQFTPDFFLGTGDVAGFNGALPTHGSESVSEGYGELQVPLLANLPAVKSLSVDTAFRYSDYDLKGVGGVWTYSGGGLWSVTQDVRFRGQFQHAIRAPNVGELYGGAATNFTVVSDPCANHGTSQSAAVAAVCEAQGVKPADLFTAGIQPNPYIGNSGGGNPDLSPETSNTITIGTVLTPRFIPDFSVSIDWYRIDVTGAIEQLSGGIAGVLTSCYYTIQSASSAYCQAIQRDPNTGQIVNVNVGEANAGALKVEGVDLDGTWGHDLSRGLFRQSSSVQVSTDWTWQGEYEIVPIAALPNDREECAGAYGPTCGEPIPKIKGVTRVTWINGPVDVTVGWRFIDSVTIDKYLLPLRAGSTTVPPLDTLTNPVLPTANYLDLGVAWNVTDNLQLSGGVNNVLGWGPPIVGSSAGYGNTWPATYDPYGQTFYFDFKAKFD
ncbi:MAG: TonB-dependent receptor [Steroidobacteraceae bacterium]